MVISKTIIILLLVFCAVYLWLNFNFTIFETKEFLGLIRKPAMSDTQFENYIPLVYLFPVSSDKETPTPKAVSVSVQSRQTIPDTMSVDSSLLLSIPSLGVSAPIVFEPTVNEDRIYKQLEKGVVHYAETPLPGQNGTAVIIGHSSVYPWYKGKYGYVFSSLSKLKAGDAIRIEKNGEILNYKVSRSLIFSPVLADDFELRSLESTGGSAIVLMTCWPTGTNAKRIAVRADLI